MTAGASYAPGGGTTIDANDQAGAAYTLAIGDAGKAVRMTNAAANVVTVPPDSAVNFAVGTVIAVQQMGAGQTSLAAGAGVTLNSPGGALAIDAVFGILSLRKSAANTWEVEGRLRPLAVTNIVTEATVARALVLTDAGATIKTTNAAATTVTIPLNATVAFPLGTVIEVFQYGTGQVTFAGAGGVTVRSPSGWLKIGSQYGFATLTKLAADEWSLEGRLSA